MINIYCDGSCIVTKRVGGWGVYIRKGDDCFSIYGHDPDTTNNIMELTAAINAIKYLPDDVKARVHSDSQYVITGITSWIDGWKKRNWNKVKNVELWKELDALNQTKQVEWVKVLGHSGIHGNEVADTLANSGTANTVQCEYSLSDLEAFLHS